MALSNNPICTELQTPRITATSTVSPSRSMNSAITLFYMFQVCMYWISYRLAQSHHGQGAIGESLATADEQSHRRRNILHFRASRFPHELHGHHRRVNPWKMKSDKTARFSVQIRVFPRYRGSAPPAQFRWKPGQSGNPKGRPSGAAATVEWMNAMADFTDEQTASRR